MTKSPASATGIDDPRRCRLLDAAITTFARFGFRKTSMEEVARAAHLSRQGLYLHFSTKEELFAEAVRHALEGASRSAAARLRDDTLELEEKLVGAFDEWIGRCVGLFGSDVTDINEGGEAILGPLVAKYDEGFVEGVAKVIRASGLAATYESAGVTARQLAHTLHATARGLKHGTVARSDFRERFRVAVRALCMPLRAPA